MKVLMVGDVAGAPGRRLLMREAERLKSEGAVDLIVANVENAAGGKGLTPPLADTLFAAGVDVLTLGDHAWDRRDIIPYLSQEPRLIRPVNFAPGCPGRGCTTLYAGRTRVSVISLIGRVFMNPAYDCPFRAVDAVLSEQADLGTVILVDFHAEATSEKIVMGRYLDGRVSAVVGSHTHVQTSDETVLPGGTAYLTDLGMTGAKDSAIGRDLESVTQMFLTGMPAAFKIAQEGVALEGALVEIRPRTGRATRIRRVRITE
ncbi:MAG: YmdB family metallophosphoesterase [Lentisphaerae bacterium]|nr:YmdB family metallophosphoesterase [Lentisphaerota bacterium]